VGKPDETQESQSSLGDINPAVARCSGTYNPNDYHTQPPHGALPCSCSGYIGDDEGREPCTNRFFDPHTPGDPPEPNRKCGHSRDRHIMVP
jgi:hypothetical protein